MNMKTVLIILGVALILISIASDQLGLSAGEGIGFGQVFIFASGLTSVLSLMKYTPGPELLLSHTTVCSPQLISSETSSLI